MPSIADSNIEKVQLLLDDLGQSLELRSSIKGFADEAKREVAWNRWSRTLALVAVVVLLALLVVMLWLVVSAARFEALRANPSALSVILAAGVGGGVVLTGTTIKAVFSSFAERNAGVPMPEHFATIWDALKSLFGPKS